MENEKKRREQEAEVKKLTIEILEQLLLQDQDGQPRAVGAGGGAEG